MAETSHFGRRARHLDLRHARRARTARLTASRAKIAILSSPTDDKAIYYLSEESGNFNVHKSSLRRQAASREQLTSFKTVPVRFLSDGEHRHARLRVRRPDLHDAAPGGSAEEARHRRLVGQQGERRADHVGQQRRAGSRRVAERQRSRVHVSRRRLRQQRRRRRHEAHHDDAGDRNRRGFAPDGKSLIYASERGGKWAIYEARRTRDAEPYFFASTVVKETPVVTNEHQNIHPSYSPDGKELAYLEDRNTLKIFEPRDEADAHAPHRQRAVRRRPPASSGVPTASGSSSISTSRASRRARSDWSAPTARARSSTSRRAASTTRAASGSWAARRCSGSRNRDGLKSVAQGGQRSRTPTRCSSIATRGSGSG